MTKQAEDFIDKPISEMSDEELQEFVRGLRRRRQTPKYTDKKAKAKPAKKDPFANLSPEERAIIIASLEGDRDESQTD